MKYMQIARVLMNGMAGTSAMTAFSAFISYMEERNFAEPELLSKLICEWVPEMKPHQARMAAWGIQYLIGFLFVIVYEELWKHSKYKPSLKSGTVLGIASGLLGIVGWQWVLKHCKYPLWWIVRII